MSNDIERYLGPHKKLGPGSYEIGSVVTRAPQLIEFGGGYNTWGLNEGPRRGEGGPSNIQTVAKPNVVAELLNDQIHNQADMERDYAVRMNGVKPDVEREVNVRKQAAKGSQPLTPAQAAAIDQQVTLDLVLSKINQYAELAPATYGLYGQSPYFLMTYLSRQKIHEFIHSDNGSNPREVLMALYAQFDAVYKSAMDLKALSLSIEILAEQLPQLALNLERSEGVAADAALYERLNTVAKERDLHARQLPGFLQSELLGAAGSVAGLKPSLVMAHYKATLERMAASKIAAIKPIVAPTPYERGGITYSPPAHNPKINAPLRQPELQALYELVHLQTHTQLGTKWITYHDALLKRESARHLTATANAFGGLAERADRAEHLIDAKLLADEQARAAAVAEAKRVAEEQARAAAEAEAKRVAEEQARAAAEVEAKRVAEEQARAAAEAEAKRVAEEQARVAAEAEVRRVAEEQARAAAETEAKRVAEEQVRVAEAIRVANTFVASGPAAATSPLFMTASGVLDVIDAAGVTLQAAIRSAVAALSNVAAGTASGLMVGVTALIYSPKLANGELPERYAFSTPLSDLASVHVQGLQAIADASGAVDLPVRISSKTTVDGQSEVYVAITDGAIVPSKVRVVAATYNPQLNVYSVTTSSIPPRTLTWTPIVNPDNSSTTSPTVQPEAPVYTGATVTPILGRIDTFPGLAEAGFDDFITVFPVDSGLPPLYVMFRDPREDPGTATGMGQPIVGVWLGADTQDGGAAIPAQIADRLRSIKFKSFREFRETLWTEIYNDPELSGQFIVANRARMSSGKAAKTRKVDAVGGRSTFEIHHVRELAKGGDVYNIDNMLILTPKRHIEIHKRKP
ncbi:S-type Pyocin [Pseudomonas saxonica]|uniref:S-type Pyocin n=1 Tax=Pseudomonas saxonica TaxID=2600598 RepID=A0ABY3GQZ4_9PSED|nr:S-type pyocin domain-containing protein [Pseudomonas saxonica]TWR93093.1 S-type Pyocin [Pseudomonas saxonica]